MPSLCRAREVKPLGPGLQPIRGRNRTEIQPPHRSFYYILCYFSSQVLATKVLKTGDSPRPPMSQTSLSSVRTKGRDRWHPLYLHSGALAMGHPCTLHPGTLHSASPVRIFTLYSPYPTQLGREGEAGETQCLSLILGPRYFQMGV